MWSHTRRPPGTADAGPARDPRRDRGPQAPRGTRAARSAAVNKSGRSPRKPIRRCPAAIRCSTAARAPPSLSETTASASMKSRRAVDEHQGQAGGALAQQVGVVVRRRWRRSARRRRAAMNASASSRSRPGSSSELPTSVSTPRSRAASSTPRCTAPKNGLETSSKITPDRRRLPIGAAQRARREVVPVAEHLDGLAHALREVLAHTGATVDHPRHRAEAHAGHGRDLSHGRALGGPPLRATRGS